jgi:hypothetical protein
LALAPAALNRFHPLLIYIIHVYKRKAKGFFDEFYGGIWGLKMKNRPRAKREDGSFFNVTPLPPKVGVDRANPFNNLHVSAGGQPLPHFTASNIRAMPAHTREACKPCGNTESLC